MLENNEYTIIIWLIMSKILKDKLFSKKKSFIVKRSEKVGMPPGTLVYLGKEVIKEPKITVIDYNHEKFEKRITKN